MGEENKNGAAVKPDDTGRRMLAALLFGALAGAQWPEFFLPAAIIGMLLHQRVARNTILSGAISTAYVFACLGYHCMFARVSYVDVAGVNRQYLAAALAVAFVAAVFTALKKSWVGFLLLFLAVLPSLFITNTQQPVLFAAFLLIIPMAIFADPPGAAHAPLVFAAALNAFLAAGIVTVYMAAPPKPEKGPVKFVSRDELKEKRPEVFERITLRERVAEAMKADREKYGRGAVSQTLVGEKSGDVYALVSRGNGSRILLLDSGTLDVKRESFEGIADGATPWMEVDEARGLALVTKGGSIYSVDLKTFEWVDSIQLGAREVEPRACFGSAGKMFVFGMNGGTVRVFDVDEYGHFQKFGLSLYTVAPQTRGVICDHKNSRVVLGNRFTGGVALSNYSIIEYVPPPGSSTLPSEISDALVAGNFINQESVSLVGNEIWFSNPPGKNDDFAYVDIKDMERETATPSAGIKEKLISYFVLPVSFSRGTEKTP